MKKMYVDSPAGMIEVTMENGECIEISFVQDDCPVNASDRLPYQYETQFHEYFAGRRTEFDLPLRLCGSPFARKVLNAVRNIPYGKAASYASVAEAAGNPGACRAVGTVLARNPFLVVIPCHRVLGSDGSLKGYAGGSDRKRILLSLEREEIQKRQYR